MNKRPKVISLFSGCGGSDLGLIQSGFEVVFANDISKFACETYKLNFSNAKFVCDDVSTLHNFPKAEVLVGCYPCQGFSQGGARDSQRKINYLYREFDRVLRLVRPKAFIVENVSGMTRQNFKHLLNNQIRRFRLAGYRVPNPQILNACDFGVPQERKRLFIVGIRSDIGVTYQYPTPTHGPNRQKPFVTQQDVLRALPEWPQGDFYDGGFHWYYLSRNRRRDWDQPSATIVANPRHMPLHPVSPPLVKINNDQWVFQGANKARRFSYIESALLQGFPSSFIFPKNGSLVQKYTVIGNAVPPPLFQAVADEIPNIW